MTDPRRAQPRGSRGGDFNPKAPDVVDLDALEEHSGTAPDTSDALRAANFRLVDRGATRTGTISVTRL
ncbi:hypothetical protein [Bradyrhizobium sp. WSM1743]|uniref:hypothetical protein n=1 Tax=Bradyrhizobium sp. WSM1743 TaxID=318996 RepID=UPI0003FC4279|nr:hypothetical protein [Bradyrhizobium sp. WSM1743]